MPTTAPDRPNRPPVERLPVAQLAEGGCRAALPLHTGRLRLRLPGFDDAEAIARAADDPDVARHMSHLPNPYTKGDAEAFIAEVLHRSRTTPGWLDLLVERASDGAVLGFIGIWPDEDDETVGALGYWLGRDAWGQGLASEMVPAVVRFGFEHMGLERICAGAAGGNPASARVLEKSGFTFDREREVIAPARGGRLAVRTYCLTREDWIAHRAARPTVLVVAAALVDPDNRVLLAKRPEGKAMAGLWEFPGGKVHAGETPEAALVRELDEELGIDVTESCLAPLTFASHEYPSFHLLMPLYVIRQWRGVPHPHEGQELAWVAAPKLWNYPMPPADLPLIPLLQDWL